MDTVLEVNGREVCLTHLDRVLWPDPGLTKQDLIKYLLAVAPHFLPHLFDRPLVVQRFPSGTEGESFYQKNVPVGAPDWLRVVPVEHEAEKITRYVVADNLETLLWLGNQSCLELHPWFSSVNTLDYPDFAIFDLDPMEKSTFPQVCRVALAVRDYLAALDLHCFPKTSGATGLQLYLPLAPRYPYAAVRLFVEAVCAEVHAKMPALTTLERALGKREGKIYLDYLQNGRGKTLVAPYSPRPLPGAPVSMPLQWSEVESETIRPGDFTITTAPLRLEKTADLFAPVLSARHELPPDAVLR